MTDGAARDLARAFERRGLGTPARILVDAHRPLAPLLSDLAAAVAQLTRRIGIGWAEGVVTTLADPNGLDDLLLAIDDEAGARRAEPG
jgi:hypothetical protein